MGHGTGWGGGVPLCPPIFTFQIKVFGFFKLARRAQLYMLGMSLTHSLTHLLTLTDPEIENLKYRPNCKTILMDFKKLNSPVWCFWGF